jgi:hypothetical protein
MNTQLQVVNLVYSKLKRGTLRTELLQVDDNISVQPFKDRFENELVGWGADIDIIMRNDISIC